MWVMPISKRTALSSVSGILSLVLLASVGTIACGSSTAKQTPKPNDTGDDDDSSYPTPNPSTTNPSVPPQPVLDLPGAPVQLFRGGAKLIGVTTDDQLVFLATGGTQLPSLQVVPLAGGTPTIL